jgi:hypothetical protein
MVSLQCAHTYEKEAFPRALICARVHVHMKTQVGSGAPQTPSHTCCSPPPTLTHTLCVCVCVCVCAELQAKLEKEQTQIRARLLDLENDLASKSKMLDNVKSQLT